jgi:hypothetical protein
MSQALDYARRFLRLEITSWTKQGGAKLLGTGPRKRKDELRHALEGLRLVLNNPDADGLPFIEAARTVWLPVLKRTLQATEEHGHPTNSFLPHYRLIRQTEAQLRERYGYRLSRSPATKDQGKRQSTSAIIAEALESLGVKTTNEETIRRICSPRKPKNRTSDRFQS